jgi:hypothetical protein
VVLGSGQTFTVSAIGVERFSNSSNASVVLDLDEAKQLFMITGRVPGASTIQLTAKDGSQTTFEVMVTEQAQGTPAQELAKQERPREPAVSAAKRDAKIAKLYEGRQYAKCAEEASLGRSSYAQSMFSICKGLMSATRGHEGGF